LEISPRIHDRNHEGIVARASAYAAAVDDFAAVGHAVAASTGGVVAPAHAARIGNVADCNDNRRVRHRSTVRVEPQGVLGTRSECGGAECASAAAESCPSSQRVWEHITSRAFKTGKHKPTCRHRAQVLGEKRPGVTRSFKYAEACG
jgi:hypothetical protein